MNHDFHQTVSKALDIDVAPGRLLWDAACGGTQWVSLFRDATKSRSTRYACPDAVLIVGGCVRLVLEIEEAGTNGSLPTRIAGKLTTSALCRYFIAGGQPQPVPFGKPATFVQVINSGGLKAASRKLGQYANMEHDIRERLIPLGSITEYRLIAGDAAAFESGEAGDELRRVVRAVLREPAEQTLRALTSEITSQHL
jgi:hypothetical protein